MEISDYLRVIWRRLWILILVPLLAGGIVTSIVLKEPPKYSAVADVAAPSVVGGGSGVYSGPQGIKAFVANFTATVVSPQVVLKVSKETKAAVVEINGCLSAAPVGESGLIQVTCTTKSQEHAGSIAKSAASNTMNTLFQSPVGSAQQQVKLAQTAYNTAKGKLATFMTQNGLVSDPAPLFQSAQANINSARNGKSNAISAGRPTGAFDAEIVQQTGLSNKYQPLIRPYAELNDAATTQLSALNAANLTLLNTQAVAGQANPATTVSLNATKQASFLPELIKKAAPAFGAGLFLAVLIVLLVELVSRRPRPPTDPRHSGNSHSRVSSSSVYRG